MPVTNSCIITAVVAKNYISPYITTSPTKSFFLFKMFIREIELGEENDVKIVQVDQKNEGDTGVVVWDAAIVLSKYLETIKDNLKGKSVIGEHTNMQYVAVVNNLFEELGSGTGAVGLCAGALGCDKVLLTDQPDFIEFLLHNIELNKELFDNNITAQPLIWGDKNQVRNHGESIYIMNEVDY